MALLPAPEPESTQPTFDDDEGRTLMTDIALLDEHGAEYNLTALWRERRILLVFLRHFGCRFCRQQVHMLMSVQAALRAHDVEIVLVSLGTSDHITKFKQESGFDGEVYVDPKPDTPLAYAAFRLRRGVDLVLGSSDGKVKAEKALEDGFIDGGYPTPAGHTDFVGDGQYTGDVFQVGGVFVLGAGNTCDFAYRSSYAGDHPEPNAILEAVTGVRADGSNYTFPSTKAWISKLGADQRAPTPPSSPRVIASPYLEAFALVAALALVRWPLHTAVVLAVVAACLLARWRAIRSTCTGVECDGSVSAAPAAGALPAASSVPLFTPSEVDEISLRRQLVECDCSRVTSGTDLSTDWRVVEQSSAGEYATAVSEVEALTSLDALGALQLDGSRRSSTSTAERAVLPGASRADNNAAIHQMRLTTCYLREFLSKPHPLLGRAGPTCPFVPKALKLDAMRIGVVPTGAAPSADEMVQIVRGFLPIYEGLTPSSGPTAVFKAVVLLFPHIPLASAPQLIDGTQAALKEEFVSRGLMLGEFHLLNNAPGLHNDHFFPLRTVCPALAIRHMVPSDLVFLSADKYPAPRRAAFLQSYVSKMSGQKGAKAQSDVVNAQVQLDALLAELKPAASVA